MILRVYQKLIMLFLILNNDIIQRNFSILFKIEFKLKYDEKVVITKIEIQVVKLALVFYLLHKMNFNLDHLTFLFLYF